MVRSSFTRKLLQFSTVLGVLVAVKRLFGLEAALLVGLAMNSADLNEARELVVSRTSERDCVEEGAK